MSQTSPSSLGWYELVRHIQTYQFHVKEKHHDRCQRYIQSRFTDNTIPFQRATNQIQGTNKGTYQEIYTISKKNRLYEEE